MEAPRRFDGLLIVGASRAILSHLDFHDHTAGCYFPLETLEGRSRADCRVPSSVGHFRSSHPVGAA